VLNELEETMAMAHPRSGYTQSDRPGGSADPGHRQSRVREAELEAGTLKDRALAAYKKFNNDWTMNLASMLAYNVLTSFFPLLLALLTILVSLPVVSNNVPRIAGQINQIMPGNVRSQINVAAILLNVHGAGGLLAIVSILGLLWGGTNLFGAIESTFAIIFRVKVRGFPRQKFMCLVMILIFVVLLPLSFVSSLFLTTANTTLSRILPGFFSGVVGQLVGYATSLGSLFVLFLSIYIVVPNIPVAWRDAWKGALVAAVAMWVINTIFPFYTAHFISTKQYSAAAIATAIITISWFWFFSVILLVGAQINALAMGIGPWSVDISRILMDYRVPADPGAPTALDALDHEDREDALPFSGVARDSQDVHEVITPSGKVETHKEAEKVAAQKRSDKDDGDTWPGGGQAASPSQDGADVAGGQRTSRQAHTQMQKQDGHEHHLALHVPGLLDRHRPHAGQHPRAAHEMPSDLIATNIAPGGVEMATPRALFGERSGPPKGMLIIGAAIGLLTGLAQSRRGDGRT
jgi:membrane protein